MKYIKQRGAFLIEWTIALPFYITILVMCVLLCIWFMIISTTMFYMNESARFSSLETNNPDSVFYKVPPQDIFEVRMNKLAKDSFFAINELKYSTYYYNSIDDVVSTSGTGQSFDFEKTKVVIYEARIGFKSITSILPNAFTYNARVIYNMNGNINFEGLIP